MTMPTRPTDAEGLRKLTADEIRILKEEGCSAASWDDLNVYPDFEPRDITNVRFNGPVAITGKVRLLNIPGGLNNCIIEEGVIIENVDRIEFETEAQCGVGVIVNVLDETGSRPVRIYPGISSQIATLMAREPKWFENMLATSFQDFLDSKSLPPVIGENSVIRDSGRIINVSIGKDIVIEGAVSLVNGAVINSSPSSRALPCIGFGVDMENFIIEDGIVESGAILRNCYIGQGVEIGKGYTAHDSLFFANCSFENGEACALLAGPYTVSMHKGTLLIGCQTSFMNAGSSTNESNHMYKLGPAHWGVLERGVKTASGAYIMFGAKIGAFSMVMGSHKTHPDSSSFPFSYLFGDERGATVVVPGAMLRSCGLMRDEKKWPMRDRRLKRRCKLNDNITFNVLNPFTVESMLSAIDTISSLLANPADDDLYVRHKGMKFTRAALERAKQLYTSAIFKYLSMTLPDLKFPDPTGKPADEWLDLGGQIIKRTTLQTLLSTGSPDEAQQILDENFENYSHDELEWIANRFGNQWRLSPDEIMAAARHFDSLVEEDRREYLERLMNENKMLSL